LQRVPNLGIMLRPNGLTLSPTARRKP
jgi:hypothetical protein